jgi:hypothetical protein
MKTLITFGLVTLLSSIVAAQSTSKERISLELGDTVITENGKSVIESRGKCGAGEVLAFHLPEKGWFVASVEPSSDYDFQKIGKLDGNRIAFDLDGNRYEITSNQLISPEASFLDLWIVRVAPPIDKPFSRGTGISCASDFKYWVKTTLLKNQKN